MLVSQLQNIKNNSNLYIKNHLTFEQQLEKLKFYGLIVSNDAYAIKKLSHTNYYRLSAYYIPFQYPKESDTPNKFYDGIGFEHIVSLYDFDAKLRRLVFGALEVIEVYIRTQIAYNHAQKYGAFGYLSHDTLTCSNDIFNKLILDIKEESKRSDEKFVEHFQDKYKTTDLPLWAVVEVLSFGTVSRLFAVLKSEERDVIAKSIGVNQKVLAQWLHSLTIVRNICAHHSRFWNKQLRIPFAVPSKNTYFESIKKIKKTKYKDGKSEEIEYENNASVFFALSVIKFMFDCIGEEVDFINEVKQLIAEHPIVDLNAMGFIDGWEKLDIWSDV